MTTKLVQKNVTRSIDKKGEFLDLAIDFAVLTLHSICSEPNNPLQLKKFIRQMVAYSGTTYSTLLTAILYLFRLNSMKAELNYLKLFQKNDHTVSTIPCTARLFLVSLIVAHKYLHDRITSTKAWSKLSNIPITQLNKDEMEFLKAIKFHLFVATCTFEKWSILLRNTVLRKPNQSQLLSQPNQTNHLNPLQTKQFKLTKSKIHVLYHPYLMVSKEEYNQKVPSL